MALNVTATRTQGPGYVTGWPASTPLPATSSLNFVAAGQTVANHVITALNGGAVSYFSFGGNDLLVDLLGYWTTGATPPPPGSQPITINTAVPPATTAAPPTPPSVGPHAFLYDFQDGTGRYGRWNPCAPIVYLVNADRADQAMVDQMNLAIAEVEKATGLDFVYGGPTSAGLDLEVPAGADAVIGFSDQTATPLLAGGTIGVGGGTFSPTNGRVGSGFALADVNGIVSLEKLRATFMHEIAHMVGLDHVSDSGQLMYCVRHVDQHVPQRRPRRSVACRRRAGVPVGRRSTADGAPTRGPGVDPVRRRAHLSRTARRSPAVGSPSMTVTDPAPSATPRPGSILGTRVTRTEDPGLLTGSRKYLADLPLVDRLHAVFVRSDVAHGVIDAINIDDAREMPGVVAILTADNLGVAPHHGFVPVHPDFVRPPLADGKVRFVGEPIAVVLAETSEQGEDAAEMIWADIDPLPAVTDSEDALADGAPILFDAHGSNIAQVHLDPVVDGLAGADHVIRGRFVNQRIAVVPMEPDCCAAEVDAAGRLTFWASTQMPHGLHGQLAGALGMDKSEIRVITAQVGGGFGGKAGIHAEYSVVAAASRLTGRPVSGCRRAATT